MLHHVMLRSVFDGGGEYGLRGDGAGSEDEAGGHA